MGPPSTRRRKAKRAFPRMAKDILGNLGRAYVPPSSTTLSKAVGPYSKRKFVTFLYENSSQVYAPGSWQGTITCSPNDMYDFDKQTVLGNKQPLYYDTLLSSTGPYRAYKVISWILRFEVINNAAVPLNLWLAPAVATTTEIDSIAEADNWPGIKKISLTAKGGCQDKGVLIGKGHIDDVFSGFEKDLNLLGAYNSSPGSPIYAALLVQNADSTTNVDCYVRVKLEAYTELLQVDALVS